MQTVIKKAARQKLTMSKCTLISADKTRKSSRPARDTWPGRGITKMGGTKKRGEKKVKLDEFLPIYAQVKKEKDMGCYEDFLECLKLYDKEENGTMLLAELQHSLTALGEKLDQDELEDVFKDCMDPEDDDGNIPYAPFLKKMMDNMVVINH